MLLKVILTILLMIPSIASAMDVEIFQDMFGKINAKDFDAIEEFLDKNRVKYVKDPEYYVLLLNYSFAKGGQEQALIAKGKPKRGDVE